MICVWKSCAGHTSSWFSFYAHARHTAMPVPRLESLSFAPDRPELIKVGMNVGWPRQLCAAMNCNCVQQFCGGKNSSVLQCMTEGMVFNQTGIIYLCTFFLSNCRKEYKQVNKTIWKLSWLDLVYQDPCLSSSCSIQKRKMSGHLSCVQNIILFMCVGICSNPTLQCTVYAFSSAYNSR